MPSPAFDVNLWSNFPKASIFLNKSYKHNFFTMLWISYAWCRRLQNSVFWKRFSIYLLKAVMDMVGITWLNFPVLFIFSKAYDYLFASESKLRAKNQLPLKTGNHLIGWFIDKKCMYYSIICQNNLGLFLFYNQLLHLHKMFWCNFCQES